MRLELEAHEALAAEDLRVVTWLDHIGLAGPNLEDGAVVVRHAHPPGLHDADVSVLATRGSRDPVVHGAAATLAGMTLIAEALLVVLLVVPVAIVGYLFVWGARKDGEEDRAIQRRLGIRRRTRLGR